MKNRMIPLQAFLLLFLLYASTGHAQSPGLIVRPAGNGYSSVLDTNTNGFTSPTSSGFATSDVGPGYSEIAYKKIMPFKLEPVSDLRRGPNELFSDLVRTVDSSGFYVYNDGVNLLFRLRLGSIVSGSKGYSVMIDTDMKFGPVDTNYRAATTGVNGNPGFELEVVLETNFRVAVYNVDGTSTPALLTSFPIGTHSQISVALSRVSNTPDYFYDFYVPMSVLPGVTATTPLRMIATTVMSPQAATGGPKSDIYGINDSECPDPNKCLEEAVNLMPPFTPNDVRSSGPGTGAICTASPVMNVPISTGSVTISGTWTRADASKPSTAKVVLYRNGTPIDSGTYASGAAWSFANVTSSLNDVFYARAQAVGESSCSPSNSYKVIGCTNLTPVSRISITCATQRGFNGKRPVGAAVRIYTVATSGYTLFADDATTTYRVTYPTDSTWVYDGVNVNSSDPCTGGATDVPAGAYAITATATGQCESDYLNVCVGTTTVTAAPTITPATLYNSTTAFSGTAPASALLRLFRNGKLLATTTANASGAYSFSSLALNTGDSVQVSAQGTGLCVSTRVTRVVTCFTNAPVINTDNQGNLIVGATAITGKSGAPAGTVIRVYDEANALVGSTPVTATGSWSLTHTVASGKSYYAQAQTGSCGVSTSSATAPARPATTECATITSAYNENSPSVSGTIAASFAGTVRLYLDDVQIGSTAVPVNAGTWSVSIPANTLYPGGVLTVSSQATNAAERTGCPSTSTVSCTTPAAPIVSASTVTIPRNSSASFTITNSANGMLYALVDGSGTNYATSRFGNGGSLVDPTYVFGSVGTYNLSLKAISLSGPGCESTAPVTVQVTSTLPVHFLSLTARRTAAGNRVEWKVEAEEDVRQYVVERAREGQRFTDIVALPFTEGSGEKVYAWTDAGAPAGGKVWYRVREEDIDGSVHYSPVAVVASEGGIEAYVAPNPARDAATFYLSSARAARAVLLVTDAQGRSVRRQDLSLQAGFNALPLDLRGLSSGTYTVQVQASGAPVQTARLLVQ